MLSSGHEHSFICSWSFNVITVLKKTMKKCTPTASCSLLFWPILRWLKRLLFRANRGQANAEKYLTLDHPSRNSWLTMLRITWLKPWMLVNNGEQWTPNFSVSIPSHPRFAWWYKIFPKHPIKAYRESTECRIPDLQDRESIGQIPFPTGIPQISPSLRSSEEESSMTWVPLGSTNGPRGLEL